MSVLVTTLRRVLTHADSQMRAGRIPSARRAYEDLLERAQERTDRPMEVIARAMLARCHLRARELDAAREQLEAAERVLERGHPESHGRFLGSEARLHVELGPPERARERCTTYLRWAESESGRPETLDACLLLAGLAPPEERVEWLQRGIDHAVEQGGHEELGKAWVELGTAHDQTGRLEAALDAYEQARSWYLQALETPEGQEPPLSARAAIRGAVGACWAAGSVASRLEDWPLARARLEAAQTLAEGAEDCADLLGMVLSDLGVVYEAAGDVIEARRLILRAMEIAREQELAVVWPHRWDQLMERARALELLE